MARKHFYISLDDLPITERIIGVSTTLRPYKLSYFLNKSNFFDFALVDEEEDHAVFFPQLKKQISFTTFVHQDVDYGFKIFLILNKSQEGYLLPELMNIDYILIANRDIHRDYHQQLIQALHAIIEVSYIIEIQTENLKSRQHLYIDQ